MSKALKSDSFTWRTLDFTLDTGVLTNIRSEIQSSRVLVVGINSNLLVITRSMSLDVFGVTLVG